MNIYSAEISSGELDIAELFAITGKEISGGGINLKVGVAGFPDGLRQPAKGLATHEEDEISIILEGSFLLETAEGEFFCKSGDVIHIPAGEAHASTACGTGKVFYVLFG